MVLDVISDRLSHAPLGICQLIGIIKLQWVVY